MVGFVVAQPTLDVLGTAPDFFPFRQAGRAEILLLVVAVTVLPSCSRSRLRLELFVIDDSGGQVRLRPLTVS